MECDELDGLLDAYVDGELELGRVRDVERHLGECPVCRALAGECREFRVFFAASAPVYHAPPELKDKIVTALRRHGPESRWKILRHPRVYAAAALTVALAVIGTMLWPDPSKQMAAQAVFDHSRSVLVGPLLDVASDDPQVIKPWFALKLDYSPPVVGPLPSGFSLRGARVEALQNRRVAAIVYQRDQNLITLFVWPAKPGRLAKKDHFLQGYDACAWSHGNFNYLAVSALSDRELDEFTDLIRARLE